MALRVNFKSIIGTCTLVQTEKDGNVSKFHLDICQCNALAAFIWKHKNEQGETLHDLIAFFMDTQHATKLFKDGFMPHNQKFVNFKINVATLQGRMIALVLTKAGYKVIAYYK